MKLIKNGFSVGIWSENYKELAKWYTDILGIEEDLSANMDNDSFVAFQFGECWFWVGQHSEVKGKSKDPYRIMPEFYVESVLETYEELKQKGVKIIAAPFADPTDFEKFCMTIQDPEDNILQFYGKK